MSDDAFLPEVEGFTAFGRACDGGMSDWAEFGVWIKDGVFYWAQDSGCSCSCAFESCRFPADFDGHGNAHDAIKALNNSGVGAWACESLRRDLIDHKPVRA